MTVENFLIHLDLVKRSGIGWIARCPAHDDRVPSLSISEGDDCRTLLKCHAGCSTPDIVKALGLQMSDLFLSRRLRPVVRKRRVTCL